MDVGCYTENICVEDWDLWLKLSKKYSFRFINKILFLSRWHETNSQTIRDREIRRDIYKLILNEKNYCHQNGIEKTWDTAFRLSRSGLVANGDLKFLLKHTSNVHMKYLPLDVMLFGLHSIKKLLRLILSNEDFDTAKKVARKLIKRSN